MPLTGSLLLPVTPTCSANPANKFTKGYAPKVIPFPRQRQPETSRKGGFWSLRLSSASSCGGKELPKVDPTPHLVASPSRQRQPETSRKGGFWSLGELAILANETELAVTNLNPQQLQRYKNQLSLPAMSEQAQLKLLAGSALILGIDGTGLSVGKHLATAGVGKIGLVGERSLLTNSVEMLSKINSDVRISSHDLSFDSHNADSVVQDYDVIVDSLADWQSKLLASDVSMHLNKPLIHGGLFGFSCQVYTMMPGRSACLRCALPLVGLEDVPMEKLNAYFAPTVAVASAMQASAAIRLIGGLGGIAGATLIQFDALTLETSVVRELSARPDCPDCGRNS